MHDDWPRSKVQVYTTNGEVAIVGKLLAHFISIRRCLVMTISRLLSSDSSWALICSGEVCSYIVKDLICTMRPMRIALFMYCNVAEGSLRKGHAETIQAIGRLSVMTVA